MRRRGCRGREDRRWGCCAFEKRRLRWWRGGGGLIVSRDKEHFFWCVTLSIPAHTDTPPKFLASPLQPPHPSSLSPGWVDFEQYKAATFLQIDERGEGGGGGGHFCILSDQIINHHSRILTHNLFFVVFSALVILFLISSSP